MAAIRLGSADMAGDDIMDAMVDAEFMSVSLTEFLALGWVLWRAQAIDEWRGNERFVVAYRLKFHRPEPPEESAAA